MGVQAKKLSYFLLVSFLFVYLLFRCIYVPIVFDEAFTFFYYVHAHDYLPGSAHLDANNHLLNSFLSHLSYLCFGKSPWALRLPNLLAFFLFAVYAWKLTRTMRFAWLGFVTSTALLTGNFLLEFFSMSRGYGLSMAFMLMAMYHLSVFFRQYSRLHLSLSLFSMTLAVSANFSLLVGFLLILFLAGIGLYSFYRTEKNLRDFLFHLVIFLLLGIIPCYLEVQYALYLKAGGALSYGSLDGFVSVTLNTILEQQVGLHTWWVQTIIFLLFAGMLWAFAVYLYKKNTGVPLVSYTLLFGNWAGAIAMAYFMGVHYPKDRTGLYFIPLFILGLGYLADFLGQKKKQLAYLGLVLLFFPLHFLSHCNLSYVSIWPMECDLPVFYQKISSLQKNHPEPYTIGGLKHMSWEYQGLDQPEMLQPLQLGDYPDDHADFNIAEKKSLSSFSKEKYRIIDSGSNYGYYLLQRKQPLQEEFLFGVYPSPVSHTDAEFTVFWEIKDSIPRCPLLLHLEVNITADAQPFNGMVVFSAVDKNRKSLYYETVPLNWVRSKWRNDKLVLHRTQPPLPEGTAGYAVYIWNPKRHTFSLNKTFLTGYALSE